MRPITHTDSVLFTRHDHRALAAGFATGLFVAWLFLAV